MSSDLHKIRARKLKAAGLIDIDLRRKLTAGQKSAVTRKYNECRDIVNHPENYERISVSKKTAKIADWDVDLPENRPGKKFRCLFRKNRTGTRESAAQAFYLFSYSNIPIT